MAAKKTNRTFRENLPSYTSLASGAILFIAGAFIARISLVHAAIPRSLPVYVGSGVFLCIALVIFCVRMFRPSIPLFIYYAVISAFIGYGFFEILFCLPSFYSQNLPLAIFYFISLLQAITLIAIGGFFLPVAFSVPLFGLLLGYGILISRKFTGQPPVFMLLIIITVVLVFAVFQLLRVIRCQYVEERKLLDNQKAILSKLAQTQEKLLEQHKYASLAALSAGIAHEINNPLNYMIGNFGFLKNHLTFFMNLLGETAGALPAADSKRYDEARKDTEKICRDMDEGFARVTGIIENLRQIIRQAKGSPGTEDLAVILRTAVELFESSRKKQIIIEKNIREPLPFLCEPADFFSIFQNLLSNAADATKETEGLIKVSADHAGNTIEIIIEDNGEGISDADLKKIFEPFFTTKDPKTNLGIGLSLCRSFLQKYSGSLELFSEPGRGTRAVVVLPGGNE